MESFVSVVNNKKSLTNIAKWFILDVQEVLGLSTSFIFTPTVLNGNPNYEMADKCNSMIELVTMWYTMWYMDFPIYYYSSAERFSMALKIKNSKINM